MILHSTPFKLPKKIISLVLSLAFLFPSITWAFDQANFDPKTGLQLGQQFITLPPELGTIIRSHSGSNRLVIHVQDLHCNWEVQNQIAKLIEWLSLHYGLKVVGTEGADLPVNVTKLSTFPSAQSKVAVGQYLMRAGRMSGAEYYAAVGKRPVRLEGLEDRAHYAEEKRLAEHLLSDEYQGYLEDLRNDLEVLKPQLYDAFLLKLENEKTAYREGRKTLLDLAGFLVQLAQSQGSSLEAFPQVKVYLSQSTNVIPRSVDPDQLFSECDALEKAVRDRAYTQDAARELDERLTALEVVERLINISATPAEVVRFRQHPENYRVESFVRFLTLYREASSLDPGIYTLDEALAWALKFYAMADQRSQDLVQRLTARMDAEQVQLSVLTTGGYHTDQVLQALEQKGYSYLSFKPRLDKFDLANPYFSLLKQRSGPLEQVFARNQEKLALAPFCATAEDSAAVLDERALPAAQRASYQLLQVLLVARWLAEKRDQGSLTAEDLKQADTYLREHYAAYHGGQTYLFDQVVQSGETLILPMRLARETVYAVVHPEHLGTGLSVKPFHTLELEQVPVAFYSEAAGQPLLAALKTPMAANVSFGWLRNVFAPGQPTLGERSRSLLRVVARFGEAVATQFLPQTARNQILDENGRLRWGTLVEVGLRENRFLALTGLVSLVTLLILAGTNPAADPFQRYLFTLAASFSSSLGLIQAFLKLHAKTVYVFDRLQQRYLPEALTPAHTSQLYLLALGMIALVSGGVVLGFTGLLLVPAGSAGALVGIALGLAAAYLWHTVIWDGLLSRMIPGLALGAAYPKLNFKDETVVEVTAESRCTDGMLVRARGRLLDPSDPQRAMLDELIQRVGSVDMALQLLAMSGSIGGIGPLLTDRLMDLATPEAQKKGVQRVIGVRPLYNEVWMQSVVQDNPNTPQRFEMKKVMVGDLMRASLKRTKIPGSDQDLWLDVPMFDQPGQGNPRSRQVAVWEEVDPVTGSAMYYLDDYQPGETYWDSQKSFRNVFDVVYSGSSDKWDEPRFAQELQGEIKERAALEQSYLLGRGYLALLVALKVVPDFVIMSEMSAGTFAVPKAIRSTQDTFADADNFQYTKFVFNDHTPLPYAHLTKNIDFIRRYPFVQQLLDWVTVDSDKGKMVHLTRLISIMSRKVYGVARLHWQTMKEMATYEAVRDKLTYITNGVNLRYWQRPQFYKWTLQGNLAQVPDVAILAEKAQAREAMLDLVARRTNKDPEWKTRVKDSKVFAWTRRVVRYKQLFRLYQMLDDHDLREAFINQNIVLVIGGRVHQDDGDSQKLVNDILYLLHKDPRLRDRIVFYPNFNTMDMKTLAAGLDGSIMGANERREAAATGFMKVMVNGGIVIASPDGAIPENCMFLGSPTDYPEVMLNGKLHAQFPEGTFLTLDAEKANAILLPYDTTDPEDKDPQGNPLPSFSPKSFYFALARAAQALSEPSTRMKMMRRSLAEASKISTTRVADEMIGMLKTIVSSDLQRQDAFIAGQRASLSVISQLAPADLERLTSQTFNGQFWWKLNNDKVVAVDDRPDMRSFVATFRQIRSLGDVTDAVFLFNGMGRPEWFKETGANHGGYLFKHVQDLLSKGLASAGAENGAVPSGPAWDRVNIFINEHLAQRIAAARDNGTPDHQAIILAHYELMGFVSNLVTAQENQAAAKAQATAAATQPTPGNTIRFAPVLFLLAVVSALGIFLFAGSVAPSHQWFALMLRGIGVLWSLALAANFLPRLYYYFSLLREPQVNLRFDPNNIDERFQEILTDLERENALPPNYRKPLFEVLPQPSWGFVLSHGFQIARGIMRHDQPTIQVHRNFLALPLVAQKAIIRHEIYEAYGLGHWFATGREYRTLVQSLQQPKPNYFSQRADIAEVPMGKPKTKLDPQDLATLEGFGNNPEASLQALITFRRVRHLLTEPLGWWWELLLRNVPPKDPSTYLVGVLWWKTLNDLVPLLNPLDQERVLHALEQHRDLNQVNVTSHVGRLFALFHFLQDFQPTQYLLKKHQVVVNEIGVGGPVPTESSLLRNVLSMINPSARLTASDVLIPKYVIRSTANDHFAYFNEAGELMAVYDQNGTVLPVRSETAEPFRQALRSYHQDRQAPAGFVLLADPYGMLARRFGFDLVNTSYGKGIRSDLKLCLNTLYHNVGEENEVLAQMSEDLNEGGYLITSVPFGLMSPPIPGRFNVQFTVYHKNQGKLEPYCTYFYLGSQRYELYYARVPQAFKTPERVEQNGRVFPQILLSWEGKDQTALRRNFGLNLTDIEKREIPTPYAPPEDSQARILGLFPEPVSTAQPMVIPSEPAPAAQPIEIPRVGIELVGHPVNSDGIYQTEATQNTEALFAALQIPFTARGANVGCGTNPIHSERWPWIINIDQFINYLTMPRGSRYFTYNYFAHDFAEKLKAGMGLTEDLDFVLFFNMAAFMQIYGPIEGLRDDVNRHNQNMLLYLAAATEYVKRHGKIILLEFMPPTMADLPSSLQTSRVLVKRLMDLLEQDKRFRITQIIEYQDPSYGRSPVGLVLEPNVRPRPVEVVLPSTGGHLKVSFVRAISLGILFSGLILGSWLTPDQTLRTLMDLSGAIGGLALIVNYLPRFIYLLRLNSGIALPLSDQDVNQRLSERLLAIEAAGYLPDNYQRPQLKIFAPQGLWSRLWNGVRLGHGEPGQVSLHPNFLNLPQTVQNAILLHELYEAHGQGHWRATWAELTSLLPVRWARLLLTWTRRLISANLDLTGFRAPMLSLLTMGILMLILSKPLLSGTFIFLGLTAAAFWATRLFIYRDLGPDRRRWVIRIFAALQFINQFLALIYLGTMSLYLSGKQALVPAGLIAQMDTSWYGVVFNLFYLIELTHHFIYKLYSEHPEKVQPSALVSNLLLGLKGQPTNFKAPWGGAIGRMLARLRQRLVPGQTQGGFIQVPWARVLAAVVLTGLGVVAGVYAADTNTRVLLWMATSSFSLIAVLNYVPRIYYYALLSRGRGIVPSNRLNPEPWQSLLSSGTLPDTVQAAVVLTRFEVLADRSLWRQWLFGTPLAHGANGVIALHPRFSDLPVLVQRAILVHELYESQGLGHWQATWAEYRSYLNQAPVPATQPLTGTIQVENRPPAANQPYLGRPSAYQWFLQAILFRSPETVGRPVARWPLEGAQFLVTLGMRLLTLLLTLPLWVRPSGVRSTVYSEAHQAYQELKHSFIPLPAEAAAALGQGRLNPYGFIAIRPLSEFRGTIWQRISLWLNLGMTFQGTQVASTLFLPDRLLSFYAEHAPLELGGQQTRVTWAWSTVRYGLGTLLGYQATRYASLQRPAQPLAGDIASGVKPAALSLRIWLGIAAWTPPILQTLIHQRALGAYSQGYLGLSLRALPISKLRFRLLDPQDPLNQAFLTWAEKTDPEAEARFVTLLISELRSMDQASVQTCLSWLDGLSALRRERAGEWLPTQGTPKPFYLPTILWAPFMAGKRGALRDRLMELPVKLNQRWTPEPRQRQRSSGQAA